jgi:hypothetical protein
MSQFDKISFASQIFWFISFFFISYFLLLRFVLPRIYTTLKVREWSLMKLEYEIKHIDGILKVWAGILNVGIYKGVLVSLSDFLNVLSNRKGLYVDVSKSLMFRAFLRSKRSKLMPAVTTSNLFKLKMTDVLARQRFVSILGEKKD